MMEFGCENLRSSTLKRGKACNYFATFLKRNVNNCLALPLFIQRPSIVRSDNFAFFIAILHFQAVAVELWQDERTAINVISSFPSIVCLCTAFSKVSGNMRKEKNQSLIASEGDSSLQR